MKRIAIILLSLTAAFACQRFDDSAIWDELHEHEERIEKLETECKRLNTNIQAIEIVLEALKENDYITDIVKIMEEGVEVGYSITFAKSGTVTIYHGSNGADGSTPKIGIRKAADGEYYWTADDEWLKDEAGEKIPAAHSDGGDGKYITPQFRIAQGIWYISYDNGNSWMEIGKISENDEEKADPFFKSVVYNNEYLTLTLSDGTEVKIPVGIDSRIVDLFIFMGQSNMSGRGDASLAPEVPEGWGYEYKAISRPGELLHMVEPFGFDEDNSASGVYDGIGDNGPKRKGSSVAALTIAYYEHTQVPVVGVSCSKGGTSTTFWKVGGKPLNDAIQRQLAAEQWLTENGYIIRNNYMFWLQGESDRGMTVDQYKSNMISIVKEMIKKTGVTHCMMLRVGQPKGGTATTNNNPLKAQTELCQQYTEFVMASTLVSSFVDEGLMKDNWHYLQEGYNMLGTDAGKNVAYFVNTGIEPYMYDPYYQGLYYPVTKFKSIFDDDKEDEESAVWYLVKTDEVDINGSAPSTTLKTDNKSYGLTWGAEEDHNAIRNKPINAIRFITESTSGTMRIGIAEEVGSTEISGIQTATLSKAAGEAMAVAKFSTTFTLTGNQVLVIEPSDRDIDITKTPRDYTFKYAYGENWEGKGGFYTRVPIDRNEGTQPWRYSTGACLTVDVGYIE